MADKKKTFGSLQPNIDDILAWNELPGDAFAPASVSEKENFIQDRKSVSYWADAWRRLKKNTVAMVAMVIVFLIAIFAFIGPMFVPYTYKQIIKPYTNEEPEMIERFAFYERAKKAYCVIQTGESALYANIILKKGVVTE